MPFTGARVVCSPRNLPFPPLRITNATGTRLSFYDDSFSATNTPDVIFPASTNRSSASVFARRPGQASFKYGRGPRQGRFRQRRYTARRDENSNTFCYLRFRELLDNVRVVIPVRLKCLPYANRKQNVRTRYRKIEGNG